MIPKSLSIDFMKKSNSYSLPSGVLIYSAALLIMALIFISVAISGASGACITYSSSSRTITISCTTTTHLTTVNSVINNINILKKESTGVWLLSANIYVAKGGNLVIDSSDGTWLKIRSDGATAYGLKNSGTLTINTVKISSWNAGTNNYASAGTSGQIPRAYIVALSTASGKTNILNSELAYLGYSGSSTHGLDYYGSAGSLIQNNQIHHLWRAFYSSGVGGITFTKNTVHDNYEYGIDPHSGTHDMYITYNKAYNNNHGIICSVMCYNMHVTNNELYKNLRDGIFMDAGSHHSTIANNVIHDEDEAMQLPSLSYSEIYGNTITNSKYGIEFETQIGSSFDKDGRCGSIGCVSINNNIHDNHIKATSIGLWAKNGASSNVFSANTIDGSNGDRGIVVDGSKTINNVFSDNHIANARYAIRVTGSNTNSKFINNHLDTTASSGEFTLSAASALKLESTQFSSDVIRALDSTSIPVSIAKSGKITVIDGSSSKTYDTNSQTYVKTLKNNGKIVVSSVSSLTTSSVSSSNGTIGISSTSPSNANVGESNSNNAAGPKNDNAVNSERSLPEDLSKIRGNLPIKQGSNQTDRIEALAKIAQQKAGSNLERAPAKLIGTDSSKGKSNKVELNDTEKKTTKHSKEINPVTNGNAEKHLSSKLTEINKENYTLSQDYGKRKADSQSSSRPLNSENNIRHPILTLRVYKGDTEGNYILTGSLREKFTQKSLDGMKVYFTATSSGKSLKIGEQITDNSGEFHKTVNLPSRSTPYKIQAHFAQVNPYGSADSNFIIVNSLASPDSLNDSNANQRNNSLTIK